MIRLGTADTRNMIEFFCKDMTFDDVPEAFYNYEVAMYKVIDDVDCECRPRWIRNPMMTRRALCFPTCMEYTVSSRKRSKN